MRERIRIFRYHPLRKKKRKKNNGETDFSITVFLREMVEGFPVELFRVELKLRMETSRPVVVGVTLRESPGKRIFTDNVPALLNREFHTAGLQALPM